MNKIKRTSVYILIKYIYKEKAMNKNNHKENKEKRSLNSSLLPQQHSSSYKVYAEMKPPLRITCGREEKGGS